MIDNRELTDLVVAYQGGKISRALMRVCFVKLANYVFDNAAYYYEARDRDSLMKEVAGLCLEKTKRYDVSRGKAFNFFVTIIGCYIRQVKRTEENLYGMDGKKRGKA